MIVRAIVAGMCLLASGRSESQSAPPKGWRYPTKAEISQDWREASRQRFATVISDFDGDRIQDRAMLLVKADNTGAALVVMLGRQPHKALVLESLNDIGLLDVLGIGVADPGTYETACGKGYYECDKDEPRVLVLKRPGIDFFKWESANSFYYYDPKSGAFKRVGISD